MTLRQLDSQEKVDTISFALEELSLGLTPNNSLSQLPVDNN